MSNILIVFKKFKTITSLLKRECFFSFNIGRSCSSDHLMRVSILIKLNWQFQLYFMINFLFNHWDSTKYYMCPHGPFG